MFKFQEDFYKLGAIVCILVFVTIIICTLSSHTVDRLRIEKGYTVKTIPGNDSPVWVKE